MKTQVVIAQTDEHLRLCYPVMAALRPHMDEPGFLERVRRQQEHHGYRLAFLEDAGTVVAVAGYRVSECLAWGRFLYVDDLVTSAGHRSRGHGARLFAWLVEQARASGCEQLHLDSGVQRFGAHRFYLARRMDITAHHFCLKLP
jgi:GNAT superfamily N-acetyltransferase